MSIKARVSRNKSLLSTKRIEERKKTTKKKKTRLLNFDDEEIMGIKCGIDAHKGRKHSRELVRSLPHNDQCLFQVIIIITFSGSLSFFSLSAVCRLSRLRRDEREANEEDRTTLAMVLERHFSLIRSCAVAFLSFSPLIITLVRSLVDEKKRALEILEGNALTCVQCWNLTVLLTRNRKMIIKERSSSIIDQWFRRRRRSNETNDEVSSFFVFESIC